MVASVLPPLYSLTSPSLKNLSVGNPLTPNFSAKSLWIVASTFAKTTSKSDDSKAYAALAYSGAKDLQCPHHGA